MMKVIPETLPDEGYSRNVTWWRLLHKRYLLMVFPETLPDEGYSRNVTWWKLFQKRYLMKVIPETHRGHYIWYLSFYSYVLNWCDNRVPFNYQKNVTLPIRFCNDLLILMTGLLLMNQWRIIIAYTTTCPVVIKDHTANLIIIVPYSTIVNANGMAK
jgi:hypothetical protein